MHKLTMTDHHSDDMSNINIYSDDSLIDQRVKKQLHAWGLYECTYSCEDFYLCQGLFCYLFASLQNILVNHFPLDPIVRT